jgi:L-ribulose-5-phosphate 3-epimerase
MADIVSRRALLRATLAAGPALVAARAFASEGDTTDGFKLGIITDEITQQLRTALDFISEYHLHWCELRDLWNRNILYLSDDDLKEAKKMIADQGLRVSDIASPLFKWALPQMAPEKKETDSFGAHFTDADSAHVMRRSFDIAHMLGAGKVRVFAFTRVEDPSRAFPFVRDRLAAAADQARKDGLILVLENEHTCNVGTGKELGQMIREVNLPALRGNWDAGNAFMLGEVVYPDGYRHVKGLFAHMHIKDVRKNAKTGKLEWAPVGGGLIDWKGQIAALRRDKYEGTMSLETHYRRPDHNALESTRESLKGLLAILG